jgi:hypothetical protein
MTKSAIRTATLQRGATPVPGHTTVFYGRVSNELGVGQPAFVKHLSADRLAVEVVCAWLALELRLPAPEPLLVTVNRSVWPKNLSWQHGSASVKTYFGTREIPQARPISRTAASEDGPGLGNLVLQWPKLLEVAMFDHLIANDDRNSGNLLIDANRKLWIIDHERAIGAGAGMFFSDAFPSFENALLNRVAAMSPAERHAFRPRVVQFVSEAQQAVTAIPYAELDISKDLSGLIGRFLLQRQTQLLPLVLQTLGISELVSDRLSASRRPAQ